MTNIINNSEAVIHTVTPALTIGQVQVSADRRSTTANPIPEHDRIRRIVLPVGYWGELTASMNGAPAQGLLDLLTAKLREIANARLKDALTENPLARTVPLADYSVSALLAWNADSASTRGSITFTREQVEEWFPTSALFARIAPKGKGWTDFISNNFAKLAAKNHGVKKPEDADKMIALLEADAATNNPLVSEMIQRLSHIGKMLQEKTAAAPAYSMDDL